MSNNLSIANRLRRKRTGGFILLEVVLALMVFSIAVVGLTNSLSGAIDTTTQLQRDHTIQLGLDAILAEARSRDDVDQMELERIESSLGVVFSTEVEKMEEFQNRDGKTLRDLHTLRATAIYQDGSEEPETVEIYIYKP